MDPLVVTHYFRRIMDAMVLNVLLWLPLVALLVLWIVKSKIVVLINFLLQCFLVLYVGVHFSEPLILKKIWWQAGQYTIFYALYLDKTALAFLFLAFVLGIAVYFTPLDGKGEQNIAYFSLVLLLDMGLTGAFLARDIVLFYLFFEWSLIPLYFLVGFWGGAQRKVAALKLFIYTFVGSLLLLIGFLWMLFSTTAKDFLYEHWLGVHFPAGAFWLLWIGFAIKAAIVPFHYWLPLAHVEATTPVSMLLAGILLKLGGYGLLRYGYPLFPSAVQTFQFLLIALGMLSALWGSLLALAQEDLKRMVAYSSISHMGFAVIGLSTQQSVGEKGALLYFIAHGFSAALLFFLTGVLYRHFQNRNWRKFPGLYHSASRYTFYASMAFLAAMGIPGSGIFVAKLLVVLAFVERFHYWGWMLVIPLLLSMLYFLRVLQHWWFADSKDTLSWQPLQKEEHVVVWTLLSCLALLGIVPLYFL